MTALLALWLCALCAGAIYYSIPPRGTRADVYGIALWIMSSGVLVVSAVVLVVSVVSPAGIHPPKFW
ncbi:hypothetical protein QEV83_08470 [Methylocapsa sp. D3K7]|uniref:hypothetical protein n=1 Tax=Methylocapsa sp. D3K7 TaxID=3041435 RepID=UPI00244EFD09|nr:hypothetical protein [Methylocapsa sp. D3K7]WGJ16257.1 hypothetical protein QEV83_08470 [Methylocapsa sp. D3K7]